jgi:hypothetical protein
MSWTSVSNPPANTTQAITIPAGARTYNELVVENADVRYMSGYMTTSIIQYGVLPNTANNRMGFRHNTVRMASNIVGTSGVNPDASHPFEVTENAIFPASPPQGYASFVNPYGTSSNVDISHNYNNGVTYFVYCSQSVATALVYLTSYTITNNNIHNGAVLGSNNEACQWPGLLFQQNRIDSYGNANGGVVGPGYQLAINSPLNNDAAHPVVIRYNYQYGGFRWQQYSQNADIHHNYVAFNWQHMNVAGIGQNRPGSHVYNVKVHHNIFAAISTGIVVPCIETGNNQFSLLENIDIHNNTCTGEGLGGAAIGDASNGSTVSLLTNLKIYDNIFALPTGAPGITKFASSNVPAISQAQLSFAGYNSTQGTIPMYGGVAGANPNAIPNPEYNRNVLAANANGNYNTDATRNVLGVTLQNPKYATNQTGSALRLTAASASDMTLVWALDGTTYGAGAQLNWGGAGTTYTVSSATDPGVIHDYATVVVSGTPFTATGGAALPTTCPAARWARIVTAAGSIPVGTAFAIVNCTGTAGQPTGTLTFVPKDMRLAAGDTFAILKPEVRLYDSGGTNYVDAGIDARALPASTQTDTGINLGMTDYCSSGCAGTAAASGLGVAVTQGVSNAPLVMVPPPWDGGSAEAAFHSTLYLPPTGAWNKSSTGGFIGAVQPCQSAGGGITAGCNGVQ